MKIETLASELAFLPNEEWAKLMVIMYRDYKPVVERMSDAIRQADIEFENKRLTSSS